MLEDGLESGRAEKSHVRGKWCAEGMWPGREWWERPVPPDVQKFKGGMKRYYSQKIADMKKWYVLVNI